MAQQEKKKCTVAGRKSSKPAFKRYWAEGRYRHRRLRRIERHIAAHPGDLTAPAALRRIEDEAYRVPESGIGMTLPRRAR